MISLPIIFHGNATLNKICTPVNVFDNSLLLFVQKMIITMKKEQGIGLAANQVSLLKRIVVVSVIDFSDILNFNDVFFHSKNDSILVLINPVIVWNNSYKVLSKEGCLSVPGVFEEVFRFQEIKVSYQDVFGSFHHLHVQNLLSFCMRKKGALFFPQK